MARKNEEVTKGEEVQKQEVTYKCFTRLASRMRLKLLIKVPREFSLVHAQLWFSHQHSFLTWCVTNLGNRPVSGLCAWVVLGASFLGSSSPLSSVDDMDMQPARGLRPIRNHGDTS